MDKKIRVNKTNYKQNRLYVQHKTLKFGRTNETKSQVKTKISERCQSNSRSISTKKPMQSTNKVLIIK